MDIENIGFTLVEAAGVIRPEVDGQPLTIQEAVKTVLVTIFESDLTPSCIIEKPVLCGLYAEILTPEAKEMYEWAKTFRYIPCQCIKSIRCISSKEYYYQIDSPYKNVIMNATPARQWPKTLSSERRLRHPLNVRFTGLIDFYPNKLFRNNGSSTGMLELHPNRNKTPWPDNRVGLFYYSPSGIVASLDLIEAYEVAESSLVIRCANLRAFVKNNSDAMKRLEQLLSAKRSAELLKKSIIGDTPTEEQTKGIKLPAIYEKEIIPLRLITLVTKPILTPLNLLEHFLNSRGDFFPVLPPQNISGIDWTTVESLMQQPGMNFEKQLQLFPAGSFLFRDDFENYGQFVDSVELALNKIIPEPLLKLAFEGFEYRKQSKRPLKFPHDDPKQAESEQQNDKKGGAPRGPLSEAIEHVYLKFLKEGNTEILRKGKIKEFLERLKELADEKGNVNFSKYVADRIEKVKISPVGNTITTKDQIAKTGKKQETTIKGETYQQNSLSKLLTNLRKNYPLPT